MSETVTTTTMKDCTAYPQPGASDPTKRVNYTHGMILGVDDFTQEATYLLARDRWLAREALGYGTLTGLDVSLRVDPERGTGVTVSPGVALTPTGHLVEVTRDQCAYLNDWLGSNAGKIEAPEGDEAVPVFVTLRYRECLTDDQPVPGEPCRTDQSYTAPSRITDDFDLELRIEAPGQVEESAVRAFAQWLDSIQVADVPHTDERLADFRRRILVFAAAADPLPDPVVFAPSPAWGTVPPPADLVVPDSQVVEYLRAAFLVWSTEIRPGTWEENRLGSSTPPTSDAVLLARLDLPVVDAESGDGALALDPAREIAIVETDRPYLLHLMMVQEWLLRHQFPGGPTASQPPGGIGLGDAVTSEVAFGVAANAGTSTEASRADHTHGSPPDPIPPHAADANAHALAGDVTGTVGASRVVALQGRPMATAAPSEGNVLTFVGGRWRPGAPATAPATGQFVERAEEGRAYRIVAAGTIEFSFPEGVLGVVGPNDQLYNNLQPVNLDPAEMIVSVLFDGYERPDLGNPDGHRYIVKATPWYEFRDEPTSVEAYFMVGVRRFQDAIDLVVVPRFSDDQAMGRIMIEISQYNPT